MMPPLEMFDAAIESTWAYVLFSFIVLGMFAFAMLSLLVVGAATLEAWRWLRRHSWPSVIVSLQRRALR